MQFFMSRAQDLLDTYERAIGDRIKDAATKKRAELEAQRKLGQRWARRARQTGHMTDLEVIIAEENQAAMEVCLATQTSRLIALAKDKSIILLDLQSQMDLLHKFRQEDATAPTRSFEDTLRRWIQTKNSHPSPQSSLIVPSNLMSSHKCGHSPCDPSADQVSCIKLRISSIGAPNFWECRECCAVAFKAFLGAVPQALRFNSHNPVSFTDSICGFNHCSQPVDAKASTIFWGNSRHGIMTKQCIECSGDLEKPRWQLQPCDGCGRELKRAILLPMEYVACLPCLDEAMKCKVLGAPNYIDFETARQASLR